MKQTRHQFKYITLSILLLFSSCKGFNDIEFKGVDNFSFKSLDNTGISFSANVNIANPSGLGFKVKELNMKTFAAGNYLGTLTINDKVKIPPRSDSAYKVQFKLKFASILSGATTLYSISRLSKVDVEVQGYVKTRSMLITKKIDVHEKRTIEVPNIKR